MSPTRCWVLDFSLDTAAQTEFYLDNLSAIGYIIDDDLISPTPSQISMFENEKVFESAGNATFTIYASPAPTTPIDVDLTLTPITGQAADLVSLTTSATFSPGQSQTTAIVSFVDDNIVEPHETFEIEITGTNGNSFIDTAQSVAELKIDNDDTTRLRVIGNSFLEGNSGAIAAPVLLELTDPTWEPVTVTWHAVSGTADLGTDTAGPTSGTVTFSPFVTTATTTPLLIAGDVTYENDETFDVIIDSVTGADMPTSSVVTAGILNDDSPPALLIADVALNEGNTGVTAFQFSFDVIGATDLPITMQLATQDGTASDASDYDALLGPLTIPAGSSSGLATVIVNGDTFDEPDETFSLIASSIQDATPSTLTATGLIQNDDATTPPTQRTVTISNVQVEEGDDGSRMADFRVELSGTGPSSGEIHWQTEDLTAKASDQDYVPDSGNFTFAQGTVQHIQVAVRGDTKPESIEQFRVKIKEVFNLPAPGQPSSKLQILNQYGTATILDDDEATDQDNDPTDPPDEPDTPTDPDPPVSPKPVISLGEDVFVTEGDAGTTTANFVVRLSSPAPSSPRVSVQVQTHDGRANSGLDYQSRTETLSFPPGVSELNLGVSVIGDLEREPDEGFFLTLSSPTNATLGRMTAKATIRDDDQSLPTLELTASQSVDEANSHTTVRVQLAEPAALPVRAMIRLTPGTATKSADYEDTYRMVEFAPGETGQRSLRVAIMDDQLVEPNETFTVVLENQTPEAATLGANRRTVTIVDNDQALLLRTDDSSLQGRPGETVDAYAQVVDQEGRPAEGARVLWSASKLGLMRGDTHRSDEGGMTHQIARLPAQPITTTLVASLEGSQQRLVFTVDVRLELITLFDPGLEPNERDIAGALDRLCPEASGDMASVCEYLYNLDGDGARRAALQEMTPNTAQVKGDASLRSSRTQMRNIGRRQTQLRAGGRSGSQLAVDFRGQNVPLEQTFKSSGQPSSADKVESAYDQALSDLKASKSTQSDSSSSAEDSAGAAGETKTANASNKQEQGDSAATLLEERAESRLGFFVNGRVSFGEHERTTLEPGYDFETTGVTAGIDYRLGKGGYVGGAVGYSDTDTEVARRADRLDTRSYTFSLYTGYQVKNSVYIDGTLSYSLLDFDVVREIRLPETFNGTTNSLRISDSADGDTLSANLGIGYDWRAGGLEMTGFARTLYSDASIDGSSESGGAGFDLVFSDQSVKSWLVETGLELAYPMSTSFGSMFPVARVSYLHELEDDPRSVAGRFASDLTAQEFQIRTDSPDRDYFNVGMGMQFTFSRSRLFHFMVETDLDREDLSRYGLSFGYRQQF